ncbi:MAG: hypothetical protein PVI94_28400 [Desulfobacterales bacterium]|jgi:hypothetical protein
MCLLRLFTQRVKLGISDFDQYNNQIQTVLTFEPLAQTWHVELWW